MLLEVLRMTTSAKYIRQDSDIDKYVNAIQSSESQTPYLEGEISRATPETVERTLNNIPIVSKNKEK